VIKTNFKPMQPKRRLVLEMCNILHLLQVCQGLQPVRVDHLDLWDPVGLADPVDRVVLHHRMVEPVDRWDLLDLVDQRDQLGLLVHVDFCQWFHRFLVVLLDPVFHQGRWDQVDQWGQVGRVFLVEQVVLVELVALWDQRDQVGQLGRVDRLVVVDMLDNFLALDLVVSYHLVPLHLDDQLRLVFRRRLEHLVLLLVLLDISVVEESNCIQALDVFSSKINRRY